MRCARAVRPRRARREFPHRSHIEAAAELGKQSQDFRRRIGFDGVEDFGVRQRLGEVQIVLADDIEVDHEAWPSQRFLRNSRIRAVMPPLPIRQAA